MTAKIETPPADVKIPWWARNGSLLVGLLAQSVVVTIVMANIAIYMGGLEIRVSNNAEVAKVTQENIKIIIKLATRIDQITDTQQDHALTIERIYNTLATDRSSSHDVAIAVAGMQAKMDVITGLLQQLVKERVAK